jgi:hypothetical protein
MSTYQLTGVSYEIHQELNFPSEPSQNRINLWLEYNVGKLNNKISTNYNLNSGEYVPLLQQDEKDILKSIYYVEYYTNLSRDILVRTANGGSVISIKDDESSVTFEKSKDSSVEIYKIAQDMDRKSTDLVNLYKHNRCGPRDPQTNLTGYKY